MEITLCCAHEAMSREFLTNVTGEFAFKLMPKLKTKIILKLPSCEWLRDMNLNKMEIKESKLD